jgi:hypothetical protein
MSEAIEPSAEADLGAVILAFCGSLSPILYPQFVHSFKINAIPS